MEEIGRGDKGQNVRTWQQQLRLLGFSLTADGLFGPMTEQLTREAQQRAGLPPTGRVDAKTWAISVVHSQAVPLDKNDPFADDYEAPCLWPLINKKIEAEHYRKVPSREIGLIVVHTMEALERATTAEACAAFFHRPGMRNGKPIVASAHLCFDSDSIVQCVPLRHIAFAAPNLNARGVHLELGGYARQTADEWADPFSTSMLQLVGRAMAALSRDFDIPLELVDLDALAKPGARGVCTHAMGTKAFKIAGGHTDPGENAPIADLIEQARSYL